jgi:nitroreductase
MNETLKTIAERHTTRSFTGVPIKKEELDAILLAGAQAPTAGNSQRFRLIAITDKEFIDQLDARVIAIYGERNPGMMERIRERGGKMLYNAPAVIVVAIDPAGQWSSELDCGIVVENMALAATSLEVGNCINAMCVALFEGDEGEKLMERLQFPEGFVFGVALLLGYPTDLGRAHEPDMSKIIYI